MSFQIGLSGLNASSRNLDIIGHNIANANTTGMKSSRVEFSEVIANSLGTGGGDSSRIGVTVADTTQQFSQGNITVTSNDLDVAINGGGFFQLRQPDGSFTYTRNGAFRLDNLGNIVSQSGSKLMGYPAGVVGSSVTVPLRLPTNAPIAAKQTNTITAGFNLDARVGYATTIPGATAQYTTTAIAAADYSAIPGYPASYATSPVALSYYGVTPGFPATYTTDTITAADYSVTNATVDITPPGGLPFSVTLNSNITGAADLATAIQSAPGYATAGFTVATSGSSLALTASDKIAGYFTIGGADATVLTAGTPVSTLGVASTLQVDGTSATFTPTTLDFSITTVPLLTDATLTSTNSITSFDYSGANFAQFDVSIDGGVTFSGITLTSNYGSLANVAAEIQTQIRNSTGNAGFTVTLDGTNHLALTNAGTTNAIHIVNSDINANNAGIVNQIGVSPFTTIDNSASFLVDGTAVTLSGIYVDAQAIADSITSQVSGYTSTVDTATGSFVLTKTGSLLAVDLTIDPLASAIQQTNANVSGFSPITGVTGTPATVTSPAVFTITAPGGVALDVSLAGQINGAADLAAVIQAAPGYAAAGFTVTASNGNNADSTLVFSTGNNVSGSFTFSGTDAAVITTAGTPAPVDTAGRADDATPNATVTIVGPGGIPITVNLTGPIADANAMATAIQTATGYATSGFTVTVNGSDLIFDATNANTAGDITIGGPDASILTTGGTSIAGAADTFTGTIVPRTTYGTSLTAYDMQGVPTPVSLYFTKVPPSTPGTDEWAVYDTLTGPSIGSLIFNADGSLNSSTVQQLTLTPTSSQSVVPPFPVTVDFSKTTQYGTNFSVAELTQDGYTSGELVGLKIGDDGTLTARYSNGESQTAGQISLVNFRNLNGLIPVGAGGWLMSPESGAPLHSKPGVANFGSLRAGALEESNVDLTAELVNMMSAQRAYQANAQTIKTQDQVLSTLLNMR